MFWSFFILLFVFFLTTGFVLLFYVVNFFLSFKSLEKVKITSFESGFLALGKIQNSFSIHFFIIMLMFVIFDLEIVMLLGLLVSDVSSLVSFFLLLIFIFWGLYMEWFYGKLMWLI